MHAEAIGIFDRLIRLRPNDDDAYKQRAASLRASNRHDEAKRDERAAKTIFDARQELNEIRARQQMLMTGINHPNVAVPSAP